MFLKRKITEELKKWLTTNKGLLVEGSRQVGKTYILDKFLKENFENYSYVNLALNPRAAFSLAKATDYQNFLLRLSNIDNVILKPGCVIFLDEIQEIYIKARMLDNSQITIDPVSLLKDLVNNTNYRFVYSGSLLGIELYDVKSQPMGYCTIVKMYPMDFEEFLIANNVDEIIVKKIKESFIDKKSVEDFIHERILRLYHLYLLVGGMPEAVCKYLETNSLKEVEAVHKDIDLFVQKDLAKYANENEKLKIKEIYRLLPSELNSHSKRFNLNDIDNIKRGDNIILSFAWLRDAGVAIPTYTCVSPSIPLRINSDRTLLKLFHEDVGLLTYLLFDSSIKDQILNGDLNINFGSIVENAAAMSLNSHGFNPLYYFNNKKIGELDFVIEYKGSVLPIEIKSGKNYDRHLALNNILDVPNYSFDEAYVFYNGNYIKKGKVDYFPIYMIDFLAR
mgnify:CR=1 FL=1